MNRSLVVFTVSFLLGIILKLNKAPVFAIFGLILILFISALFICLKYKRYFIFLIIFAIISGIICADVKEFSRTKIPEEIIPLCRGIVTSSEKKDNCSKVTFYIYDYKQYVNLIIFGTKEVTPNDLLEIKNMKISLPDEYIGVNNFNYRNYLKSVDIFYSAMANSENVRVYGKGGMPIFKQAREINTILNKKISKIFRDDVAGIIGGLFIGERSKITDKTYNDMRDSGISHILSISGLHIMIVVSACHLLCKSFNMGIKSQRLFIILVIFFFSVITGMSSSVLRASFMVSFAFLSLGRYRDNDSITSLSLAALILLIANPYIIYNVGFQMSFLATFSILVCVKRMEKCFKKVMPNFLASSLSVSFSAQLGILPIMVYLNEFITSLTFLLNILCVPLLSLIYVFGTFSLVTGVNPFVFITEFLVKVMIFFSGKISALKFNKIQFETNTASLIGVICISLSVIYIFSGRKRFLKGLIFLLLGIVVFALSS